MSNHANVSEKSQQINWNTINKLMDRYINESIHAYTNKQTYCVFEGVFRGDAVYLLYGI